MQSFLLYTERCHRVLLYEYVVAGKRIVSRFKVHKFMKSSVLVETVSTTSTISNQSRMKRACCVAVCRLHLWRDLATMMAT
jgi:hypothetical protein